MQNQHDGARATNARCKFCRNNPSPRLKEPRTLSMHKVGIQLGIGGAANTLPG
jgi:hypothetical protein